MPWVVGVGATTWHALDGMPVDQARKRFEAEAGCRLYAVGQLYVGGDLGGPLRPAGFMRFANLTARDKAHPMTYRWRRASPVELWELGHDYF